MSKYRATPQNFLPPPKKSIIKNSNRKFIDIDNNPWLFHSDLKPTEIPKTFKQWALFNSDQWNKSWLIVYTIKHDNMPRVGESIRLTYNQKHYEFTVVKWYPSKRVCMTYLLTINS